MNIVAFVVMFLMMFAVEDAKCQTMSFLERYDLSTTVIKADTAPTDEVYSWWTESAKKMWHGYSDETMVDFWLSLPEPLGLFHPFSLCW